MTANTPTPPSLSTYELYKKATNELVKWLITTAASCGYTTPKFMSRLPVRYLQKCAEAISRKKSTEIPGHIIDTADDVVVGRLIYVRWFGDQHDSDEESNGMHQHFLTSMESTRQILVQARKERKPQSTPPRVFPRSEEASKDGAAEMTLTNLFQHLRVEEISGETRSTQKDPADSADHTKPLQEPIELLVDTDSDEEARFALLCHLQDQAAIRDFVKQTWQQYARGEISFFVATTIAEEAYTCFDRAEHDLLDRNYCHEVNSWLQFLNLEGHYVEYDDRIDVTFVDKDTGEVSPLTELLCPTAYVFLTGMLHDWDAWKDDFEQKRCDSYVPSLAAVDFAKRTHPFLERMLAIVPELFHSMYIDFPENSNRHPIHMFWGLYIMQGKDSVISYPLMVLQSYMDMFDVIGDISELAIAEYVKTVGQSKAAVDEMVEARNSYGLETTLNAAQEELIRYTEKRLSEDVRFKNALLAEEDFSTATYNSALARHVRIAQCLPTALGARVTFLKLRMHDLDVSCANEGLIVPGMAYLYKAARWYNLISEWSDLERMIALQTKASGSSFVKDIPKHGDPAWYVDHVKIYCQGLAVQRKKYTSDLKRRQQATLVHSGIEWEQLMEKYQEKRLYGFELGENNCPVGPAAKDRTFQAVVQDMARNATGCQHDNFSDIECLNALKQAWVRDEPELNFSYFGMWMVLTDKLNELRQRIEKNPSSMVRPLGTTGWTETFPAILKEAALYYRIDQKSKHDKQLPRSRLATAASMMEHVIKSSGDRYIKQSEARSGGDGVNKEHDQDYSPHEIEDLASEDGILSCPDTVARGGFIAWLDPPFGFKKLNPERLAVEDIDSYIEGLRAAREGE
ncbi:hypothetical protein CLAFUW4_08414 [Fulvia fulva]|uniref:DUF6604 domain-containing protein n=1 Tax=Passalora fulva TaxID=5499 RepID=A0A9Q8LDL1_PASFU|nr:uncharacterized protein CLAFUR5_08518 [Fulvia fulva]KAK4628931.1 hypothetical protein CLAFUR4_08419 [Fulvia fulva]KAK4629881.1 hypothetical protein CLAFUR0_08414 [Fulvia fulva]UJO15461.1 hypothetical protein CLAFUR5_08518 [Fulvia fulva]WPV13075.1 hypothetical protein CLAFUW4_08414 [Fulvia fulva]WPV27736.1 hypothetical protein CLAFUW7_08414 [Fulvia fulva]